MDLPMATRIRIGISTNRTMIAIIVAMASIRRRNSRPNSAITKTGLELGIIVLHSTYCRRSSRPIQPMAYRVHISNRYFQKVHENGRHKTAAFIHSKICAMRPLGHRGYTSFRRRMAQLSSVCAQGTATRTGCVHRLSR